VALNCVANGKVLRDGPFDNVWIQPAAGDAGGAVGAALSAYHGFMNSRAKPTAPTAWPARTWTRLRAGGYRNKIDRLQAQVHRARWSAMIDGTAEALAAQKAVGWFQGRMEFGPRSLGARSILAIHVRRPCRRISI